MVVAIIVVFVVFLLVVVPVNEILSFLLASFHLIVFQIACRGNTNDFIFYFNET